MIKHRVLCYVVISGAFVLSYILILCGIIRRFVLIYSYMYANVYKSLE